MLPIKLSLLPLLKVVFSKAENFYQSNKCAAAKPKRRHLKFKF